MNFTIAKCSGNHASTDLEPWEIDSKSLVNSSNELITPVIGNKDGSYFLRCNGTHRSNVGTDDIAHILILDGDSRINDGGEIVSGAPCPEEVSEVLTKLDVAHCIYSSYSNAATQEEITAKGTDSGGLHGKDYYKYRVIIPCTYTPEQLPSLLDYIFNELHSDSVMLENVKENRTWSQPWYFPRTPDAERLDLFQSYQYSGSILNADVIHSKWEKSQPPRIEPKQNPVKVKIDESNGRINSMQVFNQSFSVHDILIRNSYIKKGQKYLRPDSESKIPSVQLCTQCNDGKERIYSHGGDILNDGYAHDAWDCYRFLELGETSPTPTVNAFNWNMDIQRHNQRIGAKEKAAQQPKVEFNIDDLLTAQESRNGTESKTKDDPEKPKIPFSMKSFSLSGQSEIMKTKMLADRYVLDRIAILGQATTIYAKPNTGKTLLVLWMLIESIKAGRISGENVYYINADDDYKGLVYKTSLAEKHGFQMLAPGHNDFESVALQGYMRQMIDDGTASGSVIILDTLKKFTNLMEKKTNSGFMNRAREYVSNGGTLIMLAHTNKNRDADGKAVFGGTSDVVDDCDCAFILDEVAKTNTTKQVLFENIKCRGDVANELAFSYSVEEGKRYQYRLESVEPADKNATAKAKEEKIAADARAKDQEVIDAITEAIEQGITQKTPLIMAAHDYSGISKRRLTTVLTRYKGTDFSKGDLWREEVGGKNAKNYHLLSAFESTKDDYLFHKNGE